MNDTKERGLGSPNASLTPQISIPDALQQEIRRMRRSPEGYSVVRRVSCKLGCGKGKAYALTHADSKEAGSWCPTHGWLHFDSVALPPTERLTATEIEDRKQEQRRKAEFSRRNHQRSERL